MIRDKTDKPVMAYVPPSPAHSYRVKAKRKRDTLCWDCYDATSTRTIFAFACTRAMVYRVELWHNNELIEIREFDPYRYDKLRRTENCGVRKPGRPRGSKLLVPNI